MNVHVLGPRDAAYDHRDAAPQQPAEAAAQFGLREALELLRRRAKLILAVFATVVGLTLAASLALPPSYSATALLLVDPSRKDLLDPALQGLASSSEAARVDSEVEIVRSDRVLLQAIDAARLIEDEEFGPHPDIVRLAAERVGLAGPQSLTAAQAQGLTLRRLKRALAVQRRGLTFVIAITVRSGDPSKAAALANTIAATYIDSQIAAKVGATLAARDTVRVQVADARASVVDAEAAFAGYASTKLGRTVQTAGAFDMVRIRAEIDTQAGDLPPDVLTHLYGLQQVARNATAKYQTMLARLQDLETESSMQVADSRVVSEAIEPVRPSAPNVPLVVAVAGLLALGCGVGLAFAADALSGGFVSATQVELALRRRVGTSLPWVEREIDSASVADIVAEAPLAPYSEAIRRLRVMLDLAHPRREAGTGATFIVASALPGEGKSSVALALARSYALAGRRVVIVDCDLRTPSIGRLLGVEGTIGIADLIGGLVPEASLPRLLVADPLTSLVAIVGIRDDTAPTERLFTSRAFDELLLKLRRSFDYVVIDTPPLEPVVDGLYLSRRADAAVFVVQAERAPQRSAKAALERLAATMDPAAEVLVALNCEPDPGRAYRAQHRR